MACSKHTGHFLRFGQGQLSCDLPCRVALLASGRSPNSVEILSDCTSKSMLHVPVCGASWSLLGPFCNKSSLTHKSSSQELLWEETLVVLLLRVVAITKWHKLAGFRQQEFLLSELWDGGVGGCFLWRDWRESLLDFLLAPGWGQQPLAFLGRHNPFDICLLHRHSPCVSLRHLPVMKWTVGPSYSQMTSFFFLLTPAKTSFPNRFTF